MYSYVPDVQGLRNKQSYNPHPPPPTRPSKCCCIDSMDSCIVFHRLRERFSVCFDYDVTIKPFQRQNNVLESVSDDIDFKAILSPQEAFDPVSGLSLMKGL